MAGLTLEELQALSAGGSYAPTTTGMGPALGNMGTPYAGAGTGVAGLGSGSTTLPYGTSSGSGVPGGAGAVPAPESGGLLSNPLVLGGLAGGGWMLKRKLAANAAAKLAAPATLTTTASV